jgi:hypothetical protein
MSFSRAAAVAVAAVVCLAVVSCEAGGGGTPKVAPSIRDLRTEDTTGPYVSVAVDNHFHDVHPEDNIRIAADRPFIVKNQGSNTHNVTIAGTDIDEDLKPGEEIEFDPVGEMLGVGPQTLICRIHANQGMTGQFVVFEDT